MQPKPPVPCSRLHTSRWTPACGGMKLWGEGQRKRHFLSWASVCPQFQRSSKLALHGGGFGFPFLQHSLHLKTAAHPAEVCEGWAFICTCSPLHPRAGDTALAAQRRSQMGAGAKAGSPQGPSPSPLASKVKQRDEVSHG